ncbi:MAG: type II toxin-antitoxin system RelE/ParE family toxin [Paludibacteraceae bacterium]|nr:type II toxin-antitoxin system RelE/ParE family toxin [Paludibacteraceae bacterium]
METKPKFEVFLTKEVNDYLTTLPLKARFKILSNIEKSRYVKDSELFAKLSGYDLWEFRTIYNKIKYRLLAFWDKDRKAYVIITNCFIKKTDKTPLKEILKAEKIKNDYYNN